MTLHSVALVILLYLPGSIVLRAARSTARWNRPPTRAERLFLRVALSFLILSLVSLVLSLAGLFRSWVFVALGAVTVALALAQAWLRAAPGREEAGVNRGEGARQGVRRGEAEQNAPPRSQGAGHRASPRGPATAIDPAWVVITLVVVIGALSFFPAFEQVIGARDPTSYVLWGVRLARVGGIIDYDPLVAALDSEHVRTFFGPGLLGSRAHYGSRFVGFYLADPETGRVEAHGLPLYPVWIGHGHLAADVTGALATTPLLAIFACLCIFFLGYRVWSPYVGALAALWLALSPPQVWFARYANAEILAQILVLIGLYALVIYRRHQSRPFGAMAAAAFGLSWLTAAWLVWLTVPLYALLVYDLARARVRRDEMYGFWAPLFALGICSLLYYRIWAWAYFFDLTITVEVALRVRAITIAATLATLTLVGSWVWGRWRRGQPVAAEETHREGKDRPDGSGEDHGARASSTVVNGAFVGAALRWSAAAVLVLMAGYGIWLRPVWNPYWQRMSVPHLVLGITAIVYWLAACGLVLMLASRRELCRGREVFVTFVGAGVPVLIQPQIIPLNMWAQRRFLPVVIPLVLLLGAYGVWRAWVLLSRRAKRGRTDVGLDDTRGRHRGVALWGSRAVLALGIALATSASFELAIRSTPYRMSKHSHGARAVLDQIADSIEPDSLLIFDARSGWRLLDLAPGLSYAKGFDVVSVFRRDADMESLWPFFVSLTQRGRPIYFFTQGFNYYFSRPGAIRHRRWSYWLEEMVEVPRALPTSFDGSRHPFTSYKLDVGRTNGPLEGILDIGIWDDIYVGEMLPPEIDGRTVLRWAKGTAYVWLPGLDDDASHIGIYMHSPQIPSQPDRTLLVKLDDIELGRVSFRRDWYTYVFEIPPEWELEEGEVPRLELVTQPFRPAEEFGGVDWRWLGVRLDTVLWWNEDSDEAHSPDPLP